MPKRKDFEKALTNLDGLFTNEPIRVATDNKDTALKCKKLRFLVNKFMPYEELLNCQLKHAIKLQNDYQVLPTAREIYKQILDYKVSKLKKFNNDPRKKAFIDMSDCLVNWTAKDFLNIVGRSYQDKTKTIIHIKYKGNICIPFSNCHCYTAAPDLIGQLLDIKDNFDGTYSGNLYCYREKNLIIQFNFNIKPEKDYWLCEFVLNHHQKPLGQCLSNIGAVLHVLTMTTLRPNSEKYFNDLDEIVREFPIECCVGAIGALEYLDFYKNKLVYKAGNTYIYGNDVKEYMENNYPGEEYTKLDGWLINGYWKLISGMGTDQQGKPIKNLTWVVPYSNVQDTKMESNENETRFVPIHALDRVEQRYKVNLSSEDLEYIRQECLKGNCKKLAVKDRMGRIKQSQSKWGCYRIKYKQKYFDFVLSRYQDDYRIATFLPEPKDPNYLIIDSKIYNEFVQSLKGE